MSISEYHAYGEAIDRLLRLRASAVALKMLTTKDEIPAGAIRPKKDNGHHLAQCQAFALSRRQNQTVAMLKEDHWCFAPLMAYGLVENPNDEFVNATTSFPCFPLGKYIGMVTAPLNSTPFVPEVVMVYGDPGQIRQILMAVKFGENAQVASDMDPIDSCVYAVVPVIEKGEYRVSIPDPGEISRAATREDKLIFSMPGHKVKKIVSQLQDFAESEAKAFGHIVMQPDFPQPEFYTRLFKKWGLDTEPTSDT